MKHKNIIEFESEKFDLSLNHEGLKFLLYILEKDNLYWLYNERIAHYFKNDYDTKNLGLVTFQVNSFFKLLFRDLTFDNIFHQFFIESQQQETVKKNYALRILKGLEKYIDYNNDYGSFEVEYGIKNKDLNNLTFIEFSSYAVNQNLKGLYDLLWDKFSDFIDKEKHTFSYFFSNQKRPETNIIEGVNNRNSLIKKFEVLRGENAELINFLRDKGFNPEQVNNILNVLCQNEFMEIDKIRGIETSQVDYFRICYLFYIFDFYKEAKSISFDSENDFLLLNLSKEEENIKVFKSRKNQYKKYYSQLTSENSKHFPFTKVDTTIKKVVNQLKIKRENLKETPLTKL